MMDVLGVGDADIDIYLDVNHIPGRDEKILAEQLEFHAGGMVANFLAALSRLGASCGFHGPVGEDEYGNMTLADLRANGVDVSGALIKPGEKTYFCVVMLDDSGEKALIVAPTSCVFPGPEDVSEDRIKGARHVHTTAANLTTAVKALTIAKSNGLTTSLDLEPTMVNQEEALRPLLAMVDILFVNRRAAVTLGKRPSERDAARQILSQGPRIVCVTMGVEGSLLVAPGEDFHTPAYSVKVVDSTGAGDCFAAGFTFGFLKSWPLVKIARFANAVGALSVRGRGGHSQAPYYNEVVEFLEQSGVPFTV